MRLVSMVAVIVLLALACMTIGQAAEHAWRVQFACPNKQWVGDYGACGNQTHVEGNNTKYFVIDGDPDCVSASIKGMMPDTKMNSIFPVTVRIYYGASLIDEGKVLGPGTTAYAYATKPDYFKNN